MVTNPGTQTGHPMIQPSQFDFGVLQEDANVGGSFQVFNGATEGICKKIAGDDLVRITGSLAITTGMLWTFRLIPQAPGSYCQVLRVDTDVGAADLRFAARFQAEMPQGGRILICSSPYNAFTDDTLGEQLHLMAERLQIHIDASDSCPADLTPFDVIVLAGAALRGLVGEARGTLEAALYHGTRLVILADLFMRDSIMFANHFTEPWGLRFEDREYNEIISSGADIESHTTTNGVTALRWFRPSPITLHNKGRILVRNHVQPAEGFVACSGPSGNLFAIGASLLECFLCVGSPYLNGQLFANLLCPKHANLAPE